MKLSIPAVESFMGVFLRRCLPFGLVLTGLLAVLAVTWPAESRAGQDKVLLLHSYHQGMLWTDAVTEGFTDRLARDLPGAEVSIEYLDTKRYPGSVHRQRLLEFYTAKYSQRNFDLMVACDDNAFRFALNHRQAISPETPLVFCGINFYDPAMLKGQPRVTGLVENIDIEATLRLALRLHPGVERVVVVNDTTPTGRANRHRLQDVLPEFEGQVDFRFLERLSMEELTVRLENLGQKSIVLLLSFNRDATGQVFSYQQSIARIAEACPRPIYGVWGFYLGRGLVGGRLTTGRSQGQGAAELALDILAGGPVSDLAVVKDAPNRFMFDFEQLARFDIALDRLPSDRTVINTPESVFQKNRSLILTAAGVLLALLLVILSLSILLRRLRRTQRVQAQSERQLRESRQSLIQILDSLPDAAFGIDAEGRVLFWNKSIEAMTGVPSRDMVGKGDYEYALPFYGERRPVMLDLALSWDEAIAGTYSFINKEGDVLVSETYNPPFKPDGGVFWNTARPLLDSDGRIFGAIEVIRDISEIKRTEQELLRAESYIQNIINSMPSLLVTVTPENRVTQWNSEAVRMSGIPAEQAIGQDLDQLWPDLIGQAAVQEAVRSREIKTENKVPRQREGETRYVNVTVYPLLSDDVDGVVIREDDVTDQVRLEEMMLQSEKMLTVGGLAAGMAHEINNPLAGILGSVDLILRRLQPGQPGNEQAALESNLELPGVETYLQKRNVYAMLGRIRNAADRAGKIVNDMLFFSRTSQVAMYRIDLCRLMDQALDLAATEYDLKKKYDFRDIDIVRDYQPGMPSVECEPNQLQQVFLNILANGAQAMAEGNGSGQASGMAHTRPKFQISIRQERASARIEVRDNGPGMPEAVRRRVFEPFFTTKEVGKGTGLGLSVSYFIVTEHHGGNIHVLSEPGQGSSFVITLPLAHGS